MTFVDLRTCFFSLPLLFEEPPSGACPCTATSSAMMIPPRSLPNPTHIEPMGMDSTAFSG